MTRKSCPRCEVDKDVSAFHRNRSRKDGYARICKACKKPFDKRYFDTNAAECRERSRQWRADNLARRSEYQRDWRAANPEKRAIYHASRRAAKLSATPAWADTALIDAMYTQSSALGPKYHVDHIIPLNNPLVCGLHVQTNLQVITKQANLIKSNKFDPDSYTHELP